MVPIDSGTIIIAGLVAAGNFGGLVFVAKKYAGSVDEHNKIIPAVLETLKDISKGAEKVAEGMNELYNSRNNHEARLVEVETVHKMNGCDKPAPPRERRVAKPRKSRTK